jgi:prolyl 4-hydroxylase
MDTEFDRALRAMQEGMYGKARKLLERAAYAGDIRASVKLGYFSLYGLGGHALSSQQARADFSIAAAANDAEANYWLATLELNQAEFDQARFLKHLQIAIDAKYPPALLTQGVLCNDRDALRGAAKLKLAVGQRLLEHSAAKPHTTLAERLQQRGVLSDQNPRVKIFDDVLTPLEARFLCEAAKPRLQPATVLDPNTGKPMRIQIRTNAMAPMLPEHCDLTVRVLERKLANISGQTLAHAEPMSVLHYRIGEEYKPHRDYLHTDNVKGAHTPGQRLSTVFCYLNDVELGGETEFLHWSKRVNPKLGRVVAFSNCKADGSPDPDSVHASLPVLAGEKWLATLWFRERSVRIW